MTGAVLAWDVETTGLPLRGVNSEDPRQPHIVQFAAVLIDRDTREEIECVDTLIRPDGWQITEETTAIHGVSHIRALARGIPEKDAVDKFVDLRRRADIMVAHNIDFDALIMRIAMLRNGYTRDDAGLILRAPNACTMQMSAKIVNLPPTERMMGVGLHVPKPPKLTECMSYFFNEELGNAHNALYDARACARVYFHILDNNLLIR